MPQTTLPLGYVYTDEGAVRMTVARDHLDLLTTHLRDDFASLAGMNRMRPFPNAPHASLFWIDSPPRYFVLRRSHRRGLIGRLLKDLYRDPERPLRELAAAERARRADVPTPRIVAVVSRPAAAGFWRHAVILEALSGMEPLDRALEAVRRLGPAARALRLDSIFESLAGAVAKMHEAGVLHADLQVENVLVAGGPAGAPAAAPAPPFPVAILDLDDARVVEHAVPAERLANLQRLHRSCTKRGLIPAVLSSSDCLRFLRKYQKIVPILHKKGELRSEWSRWETGLFFHRLWWALTGTRRA